MDIKKALITALALILVGALGFMFFGGPNAASVVEWDDGDEVAIPADEMAGDALQADPSDASVQRAAVAGEAGTAGAADEPRPLITIKGRVINKHDEPIASASVSLSAQGRGRRNRINPKNVITKSDGTFAFAGKGFTRMWVTLEVSHRDYAIASAFKNFDSAKGALDMGDIKVFVGGTIIGSVTDMQGNIVADAEAQLSSMDRRGRWRRGGNSTPSPVVKADVNGAFKMEHVTPGRYRVNATAPRRQRQSEGPITVVDEQTEQIAAIQLGPGFELTGTVFDPNGRPIEDADVNIRGSDRRSRERDKKTDKRGEFAFDHLAPGEYSVRVRAEGYLTNNDNQGIQVTETPPLTITMQTGLRIDGVVIDGVTGAPVASYGARLQRIGGLPDPAADRQRAEALKMFDEIRTMRNVKGLSPAEQVNLDKKIEAMSAKAHQAFGGRGGFGRDTGRGRSSRGSRRGGRDRGGRGNGGGFGGFGGFGRSRITNLPGDTGDVETHPDGRFSFPGLEEGTYVVDIGSPDHQKLRSPKIELRKGGGSPELQLTVLRGLLLQGKVVAKADGQPLRNVNVELRLLIEEENSNSNNNSTDPQRRRQMEIFRQFRGSGPRTTRILSARTSRRGVFEIENAPAGKYRLRAEAEGFTTVNTDTFELKSDKPGFTLELGALATIEGRVSGIPADKISEATVMAYSGARNYRNGEVKSDGTYEITGLEPGGYMVRAFIGDSRRYLFRQIFKAMGSMQDPNTPEPAVDVKVREGGHHRFNVTVTKTTTGTVVGQVLVNGKGATGYRASLRKIEEPGSESQGGGGFRGRFGRGRSGTVDQKGNYEIKDVEMGQYSLTVSPSGGSRGRSSGNEVAKMVVFVNPEQVTEAPRVVMEVGSLAGTITIPVEDDAQTNPRNPTKPASSRGTRVTIYKDVSVVPDPARPGSEDVLRFTARSRDGKSFEFKTLPAGSYLLQLRLGGRDTTTQTIYVSAGETTKIDVMAGNRRGPKPKVKVNTADPGNVGAKSGNAKQGNKG